MSEAEAETKYEKHNITQGEIWGILEQQYLDGFMAPCPSQNKAFNSIPHNQPLLLDHLDQIRRK